ncbi:unnamed protein product [Mytilus coruscus]|uniref:Uncharacterized protein n=1 Tax=Mytilus coruscus TaxID=42192 RepID=A0A6J8DUJ8_MYTCO|nr:unnamed protein product [Mytilus coruscus]
MKADYIENDSESYITDIEIRRVNQDNTLNTLGNKLLELCSSSGLRILNGRFLGDSLGYFTYICNTGFSTVDYATAKNVKKEILDLKMQHFDSNKLGVDGANEKLTNILQTIAENTCKGISKPTKKKKKKIKQDQGTPASYDKPFVNKLKRELNILEDNIELNMETDVPITFAEVKLVISNLKVNKPAGPDRIVNEILKHSQPIPQFYM